MHPSLTRWQFCFLTWLIAGLLFAPTLHAQKKGSSNTSITLGVSLDNLHVHVAAPVGIIGELGLREWGTIGVYGGYWKRRIILDDEGWTAGARITLQPRGIAEAILGKPLNTYGFKPYIGLAAGWPGTRSYQTISDIFTYSPIYGLRYYPIDRWGLLVEWGEAFNGQTGLNVGISYGGRR